MLVFLAVYKHLIILEVILLHINPQPALVHSQVNQLTHSETITSAYNLAEITPLAHSFSIKFASDSNFALAKTI